jgi:general stress protein YciG
MSPDRVREISRLGGKAAHQKGVAHEFTREEAQAAGRKGGLAAHAHDVHKADGHSVAPGVEASATTGKPATQGRTEPKDPTGTPDDSGEEKIPSA